MCEPRIYIFKIKDPLIDIRILVYIEYTGRCFDGWELVIPIHGYSIPVSKDLVNKFMAKRRIQDVYYSVELNGEPLSRRIWREVEWFVEQV
jgi:hypothetical protein